MTTTNTTKHTSENSKIEKYIEAQHHFPHLTPAIEDLQKRNVSDGVVMPGGKKYLMVKDRVEIFRKHFGHRYGIETSIEYADDTYVRMKAIIRDLLTDNLIVGCGHAEELRGSTKVNKTSALENAETGAIGRALASIGLAGGEYASANELETVKRKEAIQSEKEFTPPPPATPQPAPQPAPQPTQTDEDFEI